MKYMTRVASGLDFSPPPSSFSFLFLTTESRAVARKLVCSVPKTTIIAQCLEYGETR